MLTHHKKRLLKIGVIAAILGVLFVLSSKPTYAQEGTGRRSTRHPN